MAGLLAGLISEAEILAAQANSPLVQAGIIETANAAAEYWESLAPVGTHEHTLKSGYVDRPGDYKRAVQVTFSRKDGIPKARVEDTDYKRAWIEYGSIHNDELAPRQRTAERFGASVPD
jgi:hypothetical protein